jgi:hypothetical protein
MRIATRCPCGHEFTFETETTSARKLLIEHEGHQSREPESYLPKCPKCLKQLAVPNPNYRKP